MGHWRWSPERHCISATYSGLKCIYIAEYVPARNYPSAVKSDCSGLEVSFLFNSFMESREHSPVVQGETGFIRIHKCVVLTFSAALV